jgi:hypothetical protein
MIRNLWNRIPIGTRSLIAGAHSAPLHPLFTLAAWWSLYGPPRNIQTVVAIIIHDWGYWGVVSGLDTIEGERHPEWAGRVMTRVFDIGIFGERPLHPAIQGNESIEQSNKYIWINGEPFGQWGQFCLFHSRYYAKKAGAQPSKLCFADKLAFCLTPRWLYLPMVTLTGEIKEYLENAQTGYDKITWHKQLCGYFSMWIAEHIDGREDGWTDPNRNTVDASGVWR